MDWTDFFGAELASVPADPVTEVSEADVTSADPVQSPGASSGDDWTPPVSLVHLRNQVNEEARDAEEQSRFSQAVAAYGRRN